MKPKHLLSLVCFALVAAPMALSQQAPPPPAQPAAPAPPPRVNKVDRRIVIHGPDEGGSMGIVPPGTWWRNPETVKEVNLSADQTKRMDEIFHQNRIELIHLKASLEEEQLNLEPLLNANPPDTNRALSEISKIADLRANLEKANAKMLLALRAVLTADQWTKLSERHMHHMEIGPDGMRGFGKGFGDGKGFGFGPNSRSIMPELHIPAIDIPGKHFDARTIAGLDMKEMKIPEINIPAIDIPGKHIEARVEKGPDGKEIQIPAIDIPEIHIPAKHIDAHSFEGLKHDDIKIPEINIPEIHIPAVDIDGDDLSHNRKLTQSLSQPLRAPFIAVSPR